RMRPALAGDYIIQIAVLLRRSDRHDSLVRIASRHAVEFGTGKKAHGDAILAAVFNDLLQPKVIALFCDADPLEGAPSSSERLGDCVDSINKIHETSVEPVRPFFREAHCLPAWHPVCYASPS